MLLLSGRKSASSSPWKVWYWTCKRIKYIAGPILCIWKWALKKQKFQRYDYKCPYFAIQCINWSKFYRLWNPEKYWNEILLDIALKYLLINEDERFFAINLLQNIRPIDKIKLVAHPLFPKAKSDMLARRGVPCGLKNGGAIR